VLGQLVCLQVELVVHDYEPLFEAARVEAQIMRRLKVVLEVRVVDIVLIAPGPVPYAYVTLLVPIPAMCEELVVAVEGDSAEFAHGVPGEACRLVIF
jgi:hypothetical protein